MTISVHDVGDRRKLTCEVRTEEGDLVDPTSLSFTMREPDGLVTEYLHGTDTELAEDTTGKYYVYWDCAQVGIHNWRFEASGTVQAVEESMFACRESQVIIPSVKSWTATVICPVAVAVAAVAIDEPS